jgi:glycosyltransferase involved in cell wall biosynthesis
MFKICHLTSAHPAMDIRIFHKECRTLCDAGYQVVLIAQYGRDEVVDGIAIKAIKTPRNRLERMSLTLRRVYRRAVKEKAVLYHLHDPELLLMGFLLKLKGKKIVYDVHEDYSGAIRSRSWIPFGLRTILSKFMRALEALASVCFDAIIIATPAIARHFPPDKSHIVQNLPVLNVLHTELPIPYCARPFQIVYIGCLSALRGAKEMVRAMELLPDDLQAKLVLAGHFSPADLEDDLKKMPGWKKTSFLGWLSQRDIAALLQESRVGLVLFHPIPNHIESQPNKLFEYLSAGVPVIASDFPLWKNLLTEGRCGLVVDPLDPEAIAAAIRRLLENPQDGESMGQRGLQLFRECYNWNNEAWRLLVAYRRILS